MPEAVSISGHDHERRLTQHGEKQAQEAAIFLKSAEFNSIEVISSDAVRAYRTAELVSGYIECGFRATSELYTSSPRQITNVVSRSEKSTETLIVVGHNPTLSEVVSSLSSEVHSLTQGQCVVLSANLEDWAAVDVSDWTIENIFIPS
jgi:phosphohistidine phosphatase